MSLWGVVIRAIPLILLVFWCSTFRTKPNCRQRPEGSAAAQAVAPAAAQVKRSTYPRTIHGGCGINESESLRVDIFSLEREEQNSTEVRGSFLLFSGWLEPVWPQGRSPAERGELGTSPEGTFIQLSHPRACRIPEKILHPYPSKCYNI